jgi:cyclase
MLKTRVIPCLLLKGAGLVKTQQFKNSKYIGDPINAVRIFNDKEVDELIFLDISATPEKKEPNFDLIKDITSEAFMPFGYGGGITNLNQIEKLFNLGVEKIILNTGAFENPLLVTEASKIFGSQSIVVSVDYKPNIFGKNEVFIRGGSKNTRQTLVSYAKQKQEQGAGEIFLNSIERDGMFKGYDINTIKQVTAELEIPLIASGGASVLTDFRLAVKDGGASAVAAGSMFVFQGVHRAVLITYPKYDELLNLFE